VLGIDRTVVRALPVDVLRVEIVTADNTRQVCWALSSVQIGSWRKRGRYVCVSNTGHLGKLQLAPRAHPNDGEMDVVTISSDIDWKQRFIAHRRAQLGTHLPHPDISVERGTTASWTRTGSREHLRIDGNVVASWNEVTVSIVPDALTVLV
jgi:diacylglycerol kinase family enzyme